MESQENRIQRKATTFVQRWAGPPIELDPKAQDDGRKRAYDALAAYCDYMITTPFNDEDGADD